MPFDQLLPLTSPSRAAGEKSRSEVEEILRRHYFTTPVPATRTIVVPPFKPAGTLALAAIVGMIPTGVVKTVEAIDRTSAGGIPVAVQGALILGAFLGVLLVLAFLVARRTARRWLPLYAGSIVGGAFPLSMALVEFALLPPSLLGGFFDPTLFLVIAGYGVVGGSASLVAHRLIRTLLFGVVEDDGSYCLRCGYQIGHSSDVPAITVCPECGVPREGARYPRAGLVRAFDRARRAAPPALAVFGALALIAGAATFYRGAPVARFLARFGALTTRNRVGGSITDWNAAGSLGGASVCMAAGALHRLDDGRGTLLVVRYSPSPPEGLPPMQVMLGVESKVPGGTSIEHGTPYVVCDLDGAQAEQIVRHGLPAGLIEAFRAASANWSGTPPTTWPPPITRIDPTPFFPPEATTRTPRRRPGRGKLANARRWWILVSGPNTVCVLDCEAGVRRTTLTRRGFALVELMVILAVLVTLVLILALGGPALRRRSHAAGSLNNLQRYAAGTSSFASDHDEMVWSFTWRAGESHPPFPATQSDIQAADHQLVEILRRRTGRSDFLAIAGYVPHLSYNHIPLLDYLDEQFPAPWAVSPHDVVRLETQEDPIHVSALPFGITGPTANQFPYSSSYEIPPAFFSPDARILTPQGAIPTIAQGPGSHRIYVLAFDTTPIGRRRMSELAHPSQKAMLFEQFPGSMSHRNLFFAYGEAKTPLMLADGSAAVRTIEFANRGFQPNAPLLPQPTTITYQPGNSYLEPRTLNGEATEALDGRVRWTRSGLRGRDFGGPEVPWVD